MRGRPQQPPARGVDPEPLQQLPRGGTGGHRAYGDERGGRVGGRGDRRGAVRVDGDAEQAPFRLPRLLTADPDPGALGEDDPAHRIGGDRGAHLARVVEPEDLVPERAPVSVRASLLPYGVEHGPVAVAGGVQGEAQKPGPGDLDPPDPGLGGDPLAQDPRDLQGRQSGVPGELERDRTGKVTAAPGPRPLHPHARGHGRAQRILGDRAVHGVQHGPGEIGGGHGTSLGEEEGHSATRFRHAVRWWCSPPARAGQPVVLPARPAPLRPSTDGRSSPVASRCTIRTSSLGSNGFARNASTPAETPASTS